METFLLTILTLIMITAIIRTGLVFIRYKKNNKHGADKDYFNDFEIVVNYNKTIEQIIIDGNYSRGLDNIYISLDDFLPLYEVSKKNNIILGKIINFDSSKGISKIIEELKECGYRPANFRELLCANINSFNPGVSFSVIALEARLSSNKYLGVCVAGLNVDFKNRNIVLYDIFTQWTQWVNGHCFLFVREDSAKILN